MLWKIPKNSCSLLVNNMTADHNRIKINVGGTNFVTYWKTLRAIPNSRLARLTISGDNYDPEENEFFFDHNPQIFGCVLDFHRTGKLHFDHNLCVPKVKDELQFWRINEHYLEPCCWNRYAEYADQNNRLAEVNSVFDDTGPEYDERTNVDITTLEKHCDRLDYIRERLWLFLDNPNSSLAAKVWAITFFFLLLVSIFVLCAETHRYFRIDKPPSANMTLAMKSEKKYLMERTDLHPVLELVEKSTNFVFTVELVVRVLTCPNKRLFWKTGMNWLDLLSVLSVWLMEIMHSDPVKQLTSTNPLSFLAIFAMFKIIRIFRIFKLAKQYTGLKLLYLALRASTKELGLLCVFIVIGMIVFSTLIYYAEYEHRGQFTDIPVGFWWSIVTMTTVGYGDLCPRTWSGYIVGATCAVVGMLATGLPIPIIANNFSRYYLYANIRARLQQRKTLQQLATIEGSRSPSLGDDELGGHCSKSPVSDKGSSENDFYSIVQANKSNGIASIDDL